MDARSRQGGTVIYRALLIATLLASHPVCSADEAFRQDVLPLLNTYCVSCHTDKKNKGDLTFSKVLEGDPAALSSETWRKVLDKTHTGEMPPEGRAKPARKEIGQLKNWVESQLTARAANAKVVPQFVIRRLNRTEYNNTLRDLLGVASPLTRELPLDAVEEGFDNNGRALFTTSVVFRKFYEIAADVARRAVPTPEDTFKEPEGNPVVQITPNPGSNLFVCRPKGVAEERPCAQTIFTAFARRAFRRPAPPETIASILKVYGEIRQGGESFEMGIRTGVQAILQSFRFLYRIEVDPPTKDSPTVRAIDDFELASRLSYFLWSSMPDDELLAIAEQGKLRDQLEPQVTRMLADAKSNRFNENFASQWLQLRPLRHQFLRYDLFPNAQRDRTAEQIKNYLQRMRTSIEREPIEFFNYVRRNNRPIFDFIESDYVLVNRPLANLYGVADSYFTSGMALFGSWAGPLRDNQYIKVPAPAHRGGLITQAAPLIVTSNPSRTSLVKRGKWILEVLLDAPPPDAPASVASLENTAGVTAEGYPLTVRQRLEAHRNIETCRSCHSLMDPLGFGLEHFNPNGAWRDAEQAVEIRGKTKLQKFLPIDSAGELPGGMRFNGEKQLKEILKNDPNFSNQFARTLAKKLFVYALGRNFQPSDEDVLTSITASMKAKQYSFTSAILGVIQSDPFLKRKKNTGDAK